MRMIKRTPTLALSAWVLACLALALPACGGTGLTLQE